MTATAGTAPVFDTAAIIGVGLIGSSLARALRAQGLVRRIVGMDASADARAALTRLGIVDAVTADAAEAASGADIVMLCTPVGVVGAVAAEIAPALKPGAVLTDVGSVKGSVLAAVAPHLPAERGVSFVPAHPVAGTEESGPEAGFADLFEGRWCIVTPPPGADPEAVARVRALWAGVGALVEEMTPEHHDLVLAVTSHLPHLIAYAIVGTASDLEVVTKSEVMKFSAGGFRDFTRIAASNPVMWRDVFLNNREAVLELLGRFTEDLIRLQRAIRWSEGDTLFDEFEKTRAIRRGILELGQDVATADFGRHGGAASSVSSDAETAEPSERAGSEGERSEPERSEPGR